MLISSEQETEQGEDYAPEVISPTAEVAADTERVQLFFPYSEDSLLGMEERSLEYSSGLEKAVLEALIAGPSQSYASLSSPINPDTTVSEVYVKNGCLFVTFSSEFLMPLGELEEGWQEDEELLSTVLNLRKLAVLSVVNTMTALPDINRVQILVDTEGDGLGYRITRQEAGFTPSQDNENELLDAMSRQYSLNATASNVLSLALKCIQDKDFARLYSYIAEEGKAEKPSYSQWIDTFKESSCVLEGWSINELYSISSGRQAKAYVTLNYQGAAAETPFTALMYRESGVWKLDYSSVTELLAYE